MQRKNSAEKKKKTVATHWVESDSSHSAYSLFGPDEGGGCGGTGEGHIHCGGPDGGTGGDILCGGGSDILEGIVSSVFDPPPPAPPPEPSPVEAEPAVEPPEEPRITHSTFHGALEWVHIPVEGGWIVYSPGSGQMHAHCDPHKCTLKCRLHRTVSCGKGRGRPLGLLLLWLMKGADIDPHVHHSREYKQSLGKAEFAEERRLARMIGHENRDLDGVWEEEEKGLDSESEEEVVK